VTSASSAIRTASFHSIGPHQFKAFGNYVFPIGVNVGAGVNVSSGAPLTPLAANPNYTNGGEIPEAARGAGFQTIDGFKTRTPVVSRVDLQASYRVPLSSNLHLTLLGDVFNLFDAEDDADVRPVDAIDRPHAEP
jgi:hypothetical protein